MVLASWRRSCRRMGCVLDILCDVVSVGRFIRIGMDQESSLELGGLFALAVVLFFVPARLQKPIQCLLIFGSAALIWFCVSGYLISAHESQHRFRMGM